jgi:hypothetical protein
VEGRRWYLTGLAGVLVYVVAQSVAGLTPAPDADLGEAMERLLVDRAQILAGAALGVVAAALLVAFAVRLRHAMDDAEGGRSSLGTLTLVGWSLLLAIVVLGQLPLLAVVWRDGGDGTGTMQDVQRLAIDLNSLATYALSAPFAALSILGPTVVAWRTGFLPRWLLAVGAVELALNAVELAGIGSTAGWNAAGYAFGLGPVVWLVWVAGASIVLYRRSEP